mmetsp:Transcript_6477/g.10062  ORF Transcript_6477/g.10062 Transcript_6477/m.10062 type:complete len:143 (-) Transcript_6477:349-777(-)
MLQRASLSLLRGSKLTSLRYLATPVAKEPVPSGDKPAPKSKPAGKAAAKKAAAALAKGPYVPTHKTRDFVPVNIYKEGKDPEVKADGEYPDWLWDLLKPEPTLSELEKIPFEARTDEQHRRFFRQHSLQKIKEKNMSFLVGV